MRMCHSIRNSELTKHALASHSAILPASYLVAWSVVGAGAFASGSEAAQFGRYLINTAAFAVVEVGSYRVVRL